MIKTRSVQANSTQAPSTQALPARLDASRLRTQIAIPARLKYLDLTKGIGIFLVVFVHSLSNAQNNGEPWIPYVKEIILAFIMPLFFMISGALHGKKLQSKPLPGKKFLNQLLTSVLRPFYALSVVFAALLLIFLSPGERPSLVGMFHGILLEQSNSALVPSGVLWFLFVLFWLATISYFLFKWIGRSAIYGLLCVGLILHFLHPPLLSEVELLAFRRFAQYSLFYFLALAWHATVLGSPTYKRQSMGLITGICTILALSASLAAFTTREPIQLLNVTLLGLGFYGVFPCLFLLELSKFICDAFRNSALVAFLTKCGRNSLIIYVFHMPTFLVIKKVFPVLQIPSGSLQILTLVLGGFLAPLLYSNLLARVPVAYTFLLGRKPSF